MAAGDVDGALDVALLELVLLADVDQDGAVRGLGFGLGGLDLLDGLLGAGHEVGAGGALLDLGWLHYFRKYSGSRRSDGSRYSTGFSPMPARR